MPQDVAPRADEVRPPADGRGQAKGGVLLLPRLCAYHRAIVTAMESHGHVDRAHAARAVEDIAHQCRDCRSQR